MSTGMQICTSLARTHTRIMHLRVAETPGQNRRVFEGRDEQREIAPAKFTRYVMEPNTLSRLGARSP